MFDVENIKHSSRGYSTCMSSLSGSSPAVSIIILDVAALCNFEKLQTTGTMSSRSAGALDVDTPSKDSEPDHKTQRRKPPNVKDYFHLPQLTPIE